MVVGWEGDASLKLESVTTVVLAEEEEEEKRDGRAALEGLEPAPEVGVTVLVIVEVRCRVTTRGRSAALAIWPARIAAMRVLGFMLFDGWVLVWEEMFGIGK